MRHLLPRGRLAALGLALGAAWSVPATAQPAPSEASIRAHVATATRTAGPDLQRLLSLCKPAAPERLSIEQLNKRLAEDINRPAPPPGKAFDNLYYVGGDWSAAWALKTSDGIILLDALNNGDEVASLVDGGLRKLGMAPEDIRYVLISHGHGDHYGGAQYLVDKYHPRLVMSATDWKLGNPPPVQRPLRGPFPQQVPGRDLAVKDGDSFTLGNTTVTLYETPGHTLGTLTAVFDVKASGKTHHAMLWGGTSFNFGKVIPQLDMYIAATARMRTLAKQRNITVLLSNHSSFDGAIPNLEAMRRSPRGPNPFVMGNKAVVRALTVMNECAQAQRDRFLLN